MSLSLTVTPTGALLAVYLGLFLAAFVLALVYPSLRTTRFLLAVYCALRVFSLSVWLAAASGPVA